MSVTPVPFTFDLDFKAPGGDQDFAAPIELGDGDLLIEGIGANYDIDREDEAFVEGAFSRGLKSYLKGNAPLCYHHKMDQVIGKVIDAEAVDGKGIKVRAIVDRQPENSPLRHVYEGIKKGRINAFSVGGIFKRMQTPQGPRIGDVDILEWSATPVSIGRGTNFSVIAGKALDFKAGVEGEEPAPEPEKVTPPGGIGEEPATGVPSEPAEGKPGEGDEQREQAEREAAEAAAAEAAAEVEEQEPAPFRVEADGSVTLEGGAITAEHIAQGAITAEHFSDSLRSHFGELTPELPTIEALEGALGKIEGTLNAVASHVGYQEPVAPEVTPAA